MERIQLFFKKVDVLKYFQQEEAIEKFKLTFFFITLLVKNSTR